MINKYAYAYMITTQYVKHINENIYTLDANSCDNNIVKQQING